MSEQAIKMFMERLERYERSTLPKLLKPHNLNITQFKATVINEIKKSPKMVQAFLDNPMTLFGSILFIAEVGLTPDETIGDAFILPYKNNETGKMEAKPVIGYLGVVKILYRSELIDTITSACVFKGEEFVHELGLMPVLKHVPKYDIPRNSETFQYAYTVARMKSGNTIFRVMSKDEIIAVRDMAKYKNGLYFNDKKDPNMWMAQKTVLKQLSKLLPKDFYGSKAIRYDDAIEAGASLLLDESNQLKLIEGKYTKPARFRDVYGTLSTIPDDLKNDL